MVGVVVDATLLLALLALVELVLKGLGGGVVSIKTNRER
jgi:hypothetical protein